jgi:hypothetical protein
MQPSEAECALLNFRFFIEKRIAEWMHAEPGDERLGGMSCAIGRKLGYETLLMDLDGAVEIIRTSQRKAVNDA